VEASPNEEETSKQNSKSAGFNKLRKMKKAKKKTKFAGLLQNEVAIHHSDRRQQTMSEKIVQLNEKVIKGQIKKLVRCSVEKTLNGLLEEEKKLDTTFLGAAFNYYHNRFTGQNLWEKYVTFIHCVAILNLFEKSISSARRQDRLPLPDSPSRHAQRLQ
jgi:hypothetical protein